MLVKGGANTPAETCNMMVLMMMASVIVCMQHSACSSDCGLLIV